MKNIRQATYALRVVRRRGGDAAIVYRRRGAPYVLVVLTRGVEDREVSGAAIRDVSAAVWRAIGEGSG